MNANPGAVLGGWAASLGILLHKDSPKIYSSRHPCFERSQEGKRLFSPRIQADL